MTPPPRGRPNAAERAEKVESLARSDHADLSDRLATVEGTLRLAVDGLADIKTTVVQLRDRDGDNERQVTRLAAEFREANDKLIGMVRAGEEERRKDREAFTTALEKQAATMLETLRKTLLASVAQQFGGWLLTAMGIAAMGSISWFWTRFK